MVSTMWGVVRVGRIEVEEAISLAEGTRVLVTAAPTEDENPFWQDASQHALAAIWDNPQDDIYAQLLTK